VFNGAVEITEITSHLHLILVAAARSRAARLYTEDLQHGRVVLGVEIVNPCREARLMKQH